MVRKLFAVVVAAMLVVTGCEQTSPDDVEQVTCAEVLSQAYEARRVAASVAALKLDIPHAHNDTKKDIEATERQLCTGADPDAHAYALTVERLKEQAP